MSPVNYRSRRALCRAIIATLIKVGSILLTSSLSVYKGQGCSWSWSPVNEVCSGAAVLQCDVVSPGFCQAPPLRWPRLITAHEKRWQWRWDPCGPIHYPASCTLLPPGTCHFHRFKVMVRDRNRGGRVIKWGGEGKRNEHRNYLLGGVTL